MHELQSIVLIKMCSMNMAHRTILQGCFYSENYNIG